MPASTSPALLLGLFTSGLVVVLALLAVQSVLARRPGGRARRAAVLLTGALAAPAALAFGAGGAYPGTGAPWLLGVAVTVLVAGLAVAVPARRERLPARTVRNAPVAALVLTLLDVQLLLNRPPWPGALLTLLIMSILAAWLLSPVPVLARPSQRVAVAVAAVVLATGAFVWRGADSRHPGSFSLGSGPVAAHAHTGTGGVDQVAAVAGRSVPDLVVPVGDARPVHRYTVTARADGERFAFEPAELRFVQGERAVVTVRNALPEATAVHWHGLTVPNSQDGVSGLTQDAIPPGATTTYTFDVDDPGSYWFHAHQDSAAQVARGLYGALVVLPAAHRLGSATGQEVDRAVLLHEVGDEVTARDPQGGSQAAAAPGELVRLRVVNTDDALRGVTLRGAAFRVVALDGQDLQGPTELRDTVVQVPAGGRADLVYRQPAATAAVLQSTENPSATYRTGAADAVVPPAPPPGAAATFDPTTYGSPRPDPVRDADAFEVDATVTVTTKFGFYDGDFGTYSFINDRLYPDSDMLMVDEGDLVRVRIVNRSFLVHPFHLHGHTFTVLEHDGEATTGSPLRLDTVHLAPGESWTVAFRADNPGLWMFHCHNLQHAAQGMDFMVGYRGVSTPYRAGTDTGNLPE